MSAICANTHSQWSVAGVGALAAMAVGCLLSPATRRPPPRVTGQLGLPRVGVRVCARVYARVCACDARLVQ